MSDYGWSNSQLFQQYLSEHFLPYARPCTNHKQLILLIYDGHTLQKALQLIKWAREIGIILFVLPAHMSHILQPLDVAVFSPFKNYYYSACSAFMAENIGQIITSYDFCQIACKAYTRAMSPANIQSSFLKTAIFRYNPNVISMQQPVPCQGFRVENPLQRVKLLKTGRLAAEAYILKKEENITNKAL